MRAILLAGGTGSRLRPLTDHTPKCLVPVGGQPLLDIWLDVLARAGVESVLVNTHHLADRVEAHLAARTGGIPWRTSHEPRLLGSAGTLVANRAFLEGGDAFLAINADNLTDYDVSTLVEAHRSGGALATLAAFRTEQPRQCGILEVDEDGAVTGFEEKPEHPRSDLANAGLYAFATEVLDLVRPPLPRDIGFHLLPQLVGRARAVDIGDAYFVDVGTPEAYARVNEEWPSRALEGADRP